MSPLTTTLPFIKPISFELSTLCIGVSLATGWPLFVMTIPCDSSSSRILRHLALNTVALICFSMVFISVIIPDDRSADQFISGRVTIHSLHLGPPPPFSPHRQRQRVVIVRIRRLGVNGQRVFLQLVENHFHRPLQLRVVPFTHQFGIKSHFNVRRDRSEERRLG